MSPANKKKRWCMKCRTRHLTTSPHDKDLIRRKHNWRSGDIGRVCVDCLKYEGEVETDSDCRGAK